MEVIVKWFNSEKGYGFIEGGEEDIFMHISPLPSKDMKAGAAVEFRTATIPKGKQAVDVQIVFEEKEEVHKPIKDLEDVIGQGFDGS